MAELRINTTGTLKLFDADDSHSANIAAGTVTSSGTVLTLNTNSITAGASGTASSIAGIPFYRGDTGGSNDNLSIYTHDVSGTDDGAEYNTAYGITALDAITTGDNNTVVGSGAGTALNTGNRNTLMQGT